MCGPLLLGTKSEKLFCTKRITFRQRTVTGKFFQFGDISWHLGSVDLQMPGSWQHIGSKCVILGDNKHTAKEIAILPGLISSNPEQLVLWLCSVCPLLFLPKGQITAQAIPAPDPFHEKDITRNKHLEVCSTQGFGRNKLIIWCEVHHSGEVINIKELLDTGAYVTIIPERMWPSHWELQNVAGHMQDVGGMQLAKQSKSIVQNEGPNGQLATLRQFVLGYLEPLLGRDLMAQWGVTTGIPDAPPVFQAAVSEKCPTHKLNWKTDSPVWVEQWLLSKEKFKVLQELVDEQLAEGHIVETTSLWNSPVFVIKKANKGATKVAPPRSPSNYNVIEDMGSPQPGMPSPVMLLPKLESGQLLISKIVSSRFLCSLTMSHVLPSRSQPSTEKPRGRDTTGVHTAVGEAIILHNMDDILMCAPNDDLLSHLLDLPTDSLVAAGFKLQEEKIQRMPPWKYLGLEISKRTTVPQKLAVKNNIKTLADVQQLCGSLNWSPLVQKNGQATGTGSRVDPEGQDRDRELAGCDFECIHIPVEYGNTVKNIGKEFWDLKVTPELSACTGLLSGIRSFHLCLASKFCVSVLHLGKNNPGHHDRLVADQLGSSSVGKDLRALVDINLSMGQQCVLVANKANMRGLKQDTGLNWTLDMVTSPVPSSVDSPCPGPAGHTVAAHEDGLVLHLWYFLLEKPPTFLDTFALQNCFAMSSEVQGNSSADLPPYFFKNQKV
ncbi:hypothetical protein DUI87_04044 [Hirundo rustica rustica]|uniref:Peptidase A2 domain-containing protein n=1 Tax=Hirundo rustica rustica TaxID=333673 RepID=A0A3M0L251_HIRRU|nr:hypothetical protein DUI87_04044 [Hirundo rustica rustica]